MKICNGTFNAETHELASIFQRWPFTLSDFQKFAIDAILKGKHVIITAHTGNGKTLPADFAISHFTRIGKKARRAAITILGVGPKPNQITNRGAIATKGVTLAKIAIG